MKVLVVDDETTIRKLVCSILQRAGFKAMDAGSAQEALSQFTDDVALLLTDVVMPEMGGPELARQFRPRCPDLPVVLMSAGHEQADEVKVFGTSKSHLLAIASWWRRLEPAKE